MKEKLLWAVVGVLGLMVVGSHAQAPAQLRVYVEKVKPGKWADLQGRTVVGFSCTTTSVTNADCFVAMKQD